MSEDFWLVVHNKSTKLFADMANTPKRKTGQGNLSNFFVVGYLLPYVIQQPLGSFDDWDKIIQMIFWTLDQKWMK